MLKSLSFSVQEDQVVAAGVVAAVYEDEVSNDQQPLEWLLVKQWYVSVGNPYLNTSEIKLTEIRNFKI